MKYFPAKGDQNSAHKTSTNESFNKHYKKKCLVWIFQEYKFKLKWYSDMPIFQNIPDFRNSKSANLGIF